MIRLMGRAMMAAGGASVLILAAQAAQAAPWTSQIEAPPEMINPLIISNVCPGEAGWPTQEQQAGRDVKFILPTDRDCTFAQAPENKVNFFLGGTEKNPVRNIWWIGGKILAPPAYGETGFPQTDPGTASWPNGLTLKWVKGTAYFEGLHADMRCTCRDVIAAANLGHYEGSATLTGNQPADKTPRIVVVNSILENPLQCTAEPSIHGDIIHSQGSGTRPEVKLQNVVFRHGFQGLYLDNSTGQPAGHGATRISLDHVQIYKRTDVTCQRTENKAGTTGSVMWNVAPRDGVWFNNVWAVKGATTNPGFTIVNNCATYSDSAGVKQSDWCQGNNPDGDPVTSAQVGRSYKRSTFTGDTNDDTGGGTTPPPATTPRNRIMSKAGFAALDRVLAAEFLGQGRPNDIVAYAYREHSKAAPAGSADLCRASGITWGGDVAQDVMYITSALSAPAELDVTVGTSPPVRVSLPANQAQAGQQATVPISDKVGRPNFVLWRDGAKIAEWNGKLAIVANPPARNVSTFAGAQIIPLSDQPTTRPRAWFSAISLDQPEGNSGAKNFVVRAHRDVAADTMTARCTVEADTATASDFEGGALPAFDLTAAPNVFTADANIQVRGETEIEPDETFRVRCGDIKPASYDTPASQAFTGVIRNDDTPTTDPSRFSIRAVSASVFEGTGPGTTPIAFEVTREGSSADAASVDICQIPADVSGGVAAASDFVGGFLRQIVPFAPGETGTKYVERQVVRDADPEPDEWATFRLLMPSAGSVVTTGTANALIKDDDSPYSAVARINAGADVAFIDSSGGVWAPDSGTGGSTATNEHDFAGTTDDALYRTYRYGASVYPLQVVPGVYDVFGLFSEPDASNDNIDCDGVDAADPSDDNRGRRLIAVQVSATGGDTTTAPVIDPYCEAGFRTAHRVRLARVNAPQGAVRIEFRSASGSQAVPLVNAIEAVRVVQTEPARPQEWLNVGAPEDARYSDSASNTWRGLPPAMVSGCTSVSETSRPPIEGTEADELYWTRCQGLDMSFAIPIDVSNGKTTRAVNLLFSEMTAPEAARVMDIYVQGALQIADLDVRAASGALKRALIKTVSPVTVGSDGLLRVRVVAKTAAPATISGISIVEHQVPRDTTLVIGWKNRKQVAKADLIRLLSPTLRSASGNPLVVRKVDTTNSSVYVCHGTCPPTATRGVQPDTEAANNSTLIEIMAHAPGDPDTSMFPALQRFGSTTDSFKVTVAELLPGGALGVETIVTVNLAVKRVL